ncbi:hypothetical protein CPB85DRAFT_1481225 [Mucidula mucida]|nr:hypothetical protein CPB85DRAFT_1481225 [Mucidula mucida]
MGAGTSGRYVILHPKRLSYIRRRRAPADIQRRPDAVIALIAGGDAALRSAREGVEDSREAGIADLESLMPSTEDVLSGSPRPDARHTCWARCSGESLGLLTIGLVCVRPSAIRLERNCALVIDPVPGPEVITGSTRLKAGTATKMVLNMISTGVHIKLGKTYGNLMVDVKASNGKLVDRARRIIRTVAAEVGLPPSYSSIFADDEQLDAVVRRCDGSVKLALVVVVSGWGLDLCRDALERRGGNLRAVLEDVRYETVVRVFKS